MRRLHLDTSDPTPPTSDHHHQHTASLAFPVPLVVICMGWICLVCTTKFFANTDSPAMVPGSGEPCRGDTYGSCTEE